MKNKPPIALNDLPDKLVVFLTEHRALDSYLENFDTNSNDIEFMSESTLIDSAFIWEHTKEGHDYWLCLDGLWGFYIA